MYNKTKYINGIQHVQHTPGGKFHPVLKPKQKRSCHNCFHHKVCIVFKSIEMAVSNTSVNIDGVDAPGTVQQVFDAMANCCLNHVPQP